MDTQILHARLTVEDILKKWPQTYSVFRNRNTDCVGCLLQRFCTVQDVADSYDIPVQEMSSELEQCVNENYGSQRRTS